jgi:hypothetical protein
MKDSRRDVKYAMRPYFFPLWGVGIFLCDTGAVITHNMRIVNFHFQKLVMDFRRQ